MELKTVKVLQRRYILCPECNKNEFYVEHIWNDGKTYNWYCDNCGKMINIVSKNDQVKVEFTGKVNPRALSFLTYKNLGIIVEDLVIDPKTMYEDKRYFFEEHYCPSNYFRDTLEVIDLTVPYPDPHGIFKYEKTIIIDEMQNYLDPNTDFMKLFKIEDFVKNGKL